MKKAAIIVFLILTSFGLSAQDWIENAEVMSSVRSKLNALKIETDTLIQHDTATNLDRDTVTAYKLFWLGEQGADVDYSIYFYGEDNSASITYMEDEDGFQMGSHIYLYETTTPTAIPNWGSLYTKADNNLYFQDGAGNENQVATASDIHMFIYFGDSAMSYNVTTAWQQATNTYRDMYVQEELEGFTISNDTITFTYGGDYELNASITMDGDNGETQSMRFYNVTQTAGIPVAGALTTRSPGNFATLPVTAYDSIGPGDEVVLQIKADANGTNVFKNGLILIKKIHN